MIVLTICLLFCRQMVAQNLFQKIAATSSPQGKAVFKTPYSRLYVACGQSGIRMTDARLNLIDSFNTGGDASDIHAIEGNVMTQVYVADGSGGLVVFVASPQSLGTMTDSVQFGSPAKLVTCQGAYAYVVTLNNHVYTVNVNDPHNIFITASYYTGSALAIPEGIFVKGNYLYMAENGANGGFEVLNISSPSSITQVSKTATPGFQYDIFVQDTIAYLYEGDRLRTYSIANPASPAALDTFFIGSKKYEILSLNNLVIALGTQLSAHHNDSVLASYAATFPYQGIFVSQDTIFAVGDSLHAFRLTGNISTGIKKADTYACTLYPNPAGPVLNIESSDPVDHLEIMNAAGKLVVTGRGNHVHLTGIRSGVYFVKFVVCGETYIRRFIKE